MSFGLDIGSKTIKIVELAKVGRSIKLKSAGLIGYNGVPPDRLSSDKDMVPLSDVIKKLHREAKIQTKNVNLALPETLVFSRVIKFPLLSESEIASAVRWEAEQYIPFPIDEAVLEHVIIEKNEKVVPPQAYVQLIAAPKKVVEQYVKVSELAGFNVNAVETEMVSVSRSLFVTDQVVVIVDLGARSTNIAISKDGQLVVSRSIPTAGETLTRAVSQGLGIELTQAEEYKKAYGMSQSQLEGKIRSVLDPVMRMVADEIRKTIHFYQAELSGNYPKTVMLVGGSSTMPEMISVLTSLLNMEVLIGNPFSTVEIDPETNKVLTGYSPMYAVAVGLALRNLNK